MSKNKELRISASSPKFFELGEYDNWHALFNSVCKMGGNDDTYKLAYLICEKGGKSTQREIESTARNIINWRNGSHIPHQKNFRILTDILEISQNKELLASWNKLYGIAKKRVNSESSRNNKTQKTPVGNKPWFKSHTFGGIVLGIIITLAFAAMYQFNIHNFSENVAAPEWHDNDIPWRREVSLKVGEKVVIHGYRGECGMMPSETERAEFKLPKLETGTLLAGKLGVRISRQCNGATPAREVVFRAEHPGTETFIIFEDDVTVRVFE